MVISPINPPSCTETIRSLLAKKPRLGLGRPILVFTREGGPDLSPDLIGTVFSYKSIEYEICLHKGGAFSDWDLNTPVAAMCNVPKQFRKIEGIFQEKRSTWHLYKAGSPKQYVGRINYVIINGCAISTDVYPKGGSPSLEKVKRFGTFAELVCTHDLQKLGITTIHSPITKHTDVRRISQLSGSSLTHKETPIMDWKIGLSRRLSKFYHEARKPAKRPKASSQAPRLPS